MHDLFFPQKSKSSDSSLIIFYAVFCENLKKLKGKIKHANIPEDTKEHTPCAFHFVEIQSVSCLYLQDELKFFN